MKSVMSTKVADVLYVHPDHLPGASEKNQTISENGVRRSQNRIYLILSIEILKDRTDEEQLQTP